MKTILCLLIAAARSDSQRCLIIEEAANGWKSLTSPDYPKKFNPLTSCIYRLTAPKNERIEIEFVDFLLLNNDAEECQKQGLSMRDPATDTSIGTYCGNTKPPNYTSFGNALFMLLQSKTDGEYKGFHIKYRIYGSSPKPATEVAINQRPERKQMPIRKPVKAGGKGAKILAAMNSNKIHLKSNEEKGDFGDFNLPVDNLDMQASPHRRRRQTMYGRQNNWQDYNYGNARGSAHAGGARAPKRAGNPYHPDATVNQRDAAKPKCRPGWPCDESGNAIESSSSQPREVRCIGNGCKNKATSSKRYLTYLIWAIVIAVFGGIGWYIYQTYFAEDEEKKKKAEEDEKKKEAEGNIGAATLARGLSGPSKIPGFDAPPRYESWQDHAQPLSQSAKK